MFINLVCLFVYFKKVFFSSYYYSGLFEDFLNVYFPRFNYFYFKDFLIWWIFKNDEEVKKKKISGFYDDIPIPVQFLFLVCLGFRFELANFLLRIRINIILIQI